MIIDAHSKWMKVLQMSSTSPSATIQCSCDVLPDLAFQIELFLTMLQILSVLNFHIFEAEWSEICNFNTLPPC